MVLPTHGWLAVRRESSGSGSFSGDCGEVVFRHWLCCTEGAALREGGERVKSGLTSVLSRHGDFGWGSAKCCGEEQRKRETEWWTAVQLEFDARRGRW